MRHIVLVNLLFLSFQACQSFQFKPEQQFNYQQIYNERYEEGQGGMIPISVDSNQAYSPSIAAKGDYIVYAANTTGNYDIYLRKLNDVEIVPFANSTSNQLEPVLSPNGDYLAYIDDELDPEGDLILERIFLDKIYSERLGKFHVNATSGLFESKQNLTNDEENRVRSKESGPAWSPDGEKLAFSSNMTGLKSDTFGPQLGSRQNIWYLNIDTPGSAKRLTENGGTMPSFSPDGKYLTYVDFEEGVYQGDVTIINLESGKKVAQHKTKLTETYPVFNHNGTAIFFIQYRNDSNGDGTIDSRDRGELRKVIIDIEQSLVSPSMPVFLSEEPQRLQRTPFLNNSLLVTVTKKGSSSISLVPQDGPFPKRKNAGEQLAYFTEKCPLSNPSQFCTSALFQLLSTRPKTIINRNSVFTTYLQAYRGKNDPKLNEFFENSFQKNDTENSLLKPIAILQSIQPAEQEAEKYLMVEKAIELQENRLSDSAAQAFMAAGILAETSKETYEHLLTASKVGSESNPSELALLLLKPEVTGFQKYLKKKIELKAPKAEIDSTALLFAAEKLNTACEDNLQVSNNELLYAFFASLEENPQFLEPIKAKDSRIQALLDIPVGRSQDTKFEIEFLNYLQAHFASQDLNSEQPNIQKETVASYQKSWKKLNISNVLTPFIERSNSRYFEFSSAGEFSEAMIEKMNLLQLLIQLKSNKVLPERAASLIPREINRLNKIAISQYQQNKSLHDLLLQFYEEQINRSEYNPDLSLLFGRGSYTVQLAIQINERLKLQNDVSNRQKSAVLKLFKIAERDFRWIYFTEPTYEDNAILLGYMYQYIDEQKNRTVNKEGEKEKDVFFEAYNQYFPQFLFEENIRLYQNSIKAYSITKSNQVKKFYLNIANNYFLLNNYQKAAEFYERLSAPLQGDVFEDQTQKALYHFHYGKSLFFIGKYQESIEELNKSLAVYRTVFSESSSEYSQRASTIHLYSGMCYDLINQPLQAIARYESITQMNLNPDPLVFLESARLHKELGDLKKAIELISKADIAIHGLPVQKSSGGKIKIEWFGTYEPWTGMFGSLFSLDEDVLITGENRIINKLTKVELQQYSASIKSDIYRSFGQLSLSRNSLENLLQLAKQDDTLHGQALYFSTLFRLGEISFKMKDIATSESYYNESLELAEEQSDFDSFLIAAKNIAAIRSWTIENRLESSNLKFDEINNFGDNLANLKEKYIELKVEAALLEKQKSNPDIELTASEKELLRKQALPDLLPLEIYSENVSIYRFELENKSRKPLNQGNFLAYITDKETNLSPALATLNFHANLQNDFQAEEKYLSTSYHNSAYLLNRIFESKSFPEEKANIRSLFDQSYDQSRLYFHQRGEFKSSLASFEVAENAVIKNERSSQLSELLNESISLRSEPLNLATYLQSSGQVLLEEERFEEHILLREAMNNRIILDQISTSPLQSQNDLLKKYAAAAESADILAAQIRTAKIRGQETASAEVQLDDLISEIDRILKIKSTDLYAPSNIVGSPRAELIKIINSTDHTLYLVQLKKNSIAYILGDGLILKKESKDLEADEKFLDDILTEFNINSVIAAGPALKSPLLKKIEKPIFTSLRAKTVSESATYTGVANKVQIIEPQTILSLFSLENVTELVAGETNYTEYDSSGQIYEDRAAGQLFLYRPIFSENLLRPEANTVSIFNLNPDNFSPSLAVLNIPESNETQSAYIHSTYRSSIEYILFAQGASALCHTSEPSLLLAEITGQDKLQLDKNKNGICAYKTYSNKLTSLESREREIRKVKTEIQKNYFNPDNIKSLSLANRLIEISANIPEEKSKAMLLRKLIIKSEPAEIYESIPTTLDLADEEIFHYLLRYGYQGLANNLFIKNPETYETSFDKRKLAESQLMYLLKTEKLASQGLEFNGDMNKLFPENYVLTVSDPLIIAYMEHVLRVDEPGIRIPKNKSTLSLLAEKPSASSARQALKKETIPDELQEIFSGEPNNTSLAQFVNFSLERPCKAKELIIALSFFESGQLSQPETSDLEKLVNSCPGSFEEKLYMYTQAASISTTLFESEIIDSLETKNPEQLPRVLLTKLDSWLELNLRKNIQFLTKVSRNYVAKSKSEIVQSIANLQFKNNKPQITQKTEEYILQYYLQTQNSQAISRYLFSDQKQKVFKAYSKTTLWGNLNILDANWIWKLNNNSLTMERFSKEVVLEMPDDSIYFFRNQKLSPSNKVLTFWTGAISFSANNQLASVNKILNWQNNDGEPLINDYLNLSIGPPAEDNTPQILNYDNLDRLNPNGIFHISRCQTEDIFTMKKQAFNGYILCYKENSAEYALEFLDIILLKTGNNKSILSEFQKYNRKHRKLFLLAS